MGNLLGSPVTDKETDRGTTLCGLQYGVSSMQGWRIHMEDAHICLPELYAEYAEADGKTVRIPIKDTSLFAVFDGHGGRFCAEFAAEHLVSFVSRNEKLVQFAKEMREADEKQSPDDSGGNLDGVVPKPGGNSIQLLEDALRESFVELDVELLRAAVEGPPNYETASDSGNDEGRANHSQPEGMDESGTTALLVVVTPTHIVCANAGDSRSVCKTNGKAYPLSFDHKPDDEPEENRIRKAGGYVSGGRVDGDLAVSRGLGDFRFKTAPHLRLEEQKVSPLPEILTKARNHQMDEFIVLACDGIWDVQTNEECVKMISDIFNEGERDLGLACEEVLDMCLRMGSKDNMTTLIVTLPAINIGQGQGVMGRRQRLEANNSPQDTTKNADANPATSENQSETPKEL